jgi:hypothetical protein
MAGMLVPSAQPIRLVDVFLLGPAMIWFGVKSKDMPVWARVFLGVSGAATMAFNGYNYIAVRSGGCVR